MGTNELFLLGVFVVAGCASNTLTSKGAAPYQLNGVRSALWMASPSSSPSDGFGEATLILTTATYGCDEFEKLLDGETDTEDAIYWKSKGLLANFSWVDSGSQDAGWQGAYYEGAYLGYYGGEDTVTRVLGVMVFADASSFSNDHNEAGRSSIATWSKDTVSGDIDTEYLRAHFQAENCGTQTSPGGYDTAY